MTTPSSNFLRVLAVDPSTRGFGYAVLEGSERLVDWGLHDAVCDKNATGLRQVKALVKTYSPDIVAIENADSKDSLRTPRVRKLLRNIQREMVKAGVKTRAISRLKLREEFAGDGAQSKESMARVVAQKFPELAGRLPPPRKPWNGPDPRIALFVAVALALAAARK